ncbi:PIG-L family deacetylase [Reichenbachiella versicolor]|uniref:PIG-L family deacetylase n=1 Tax=Reichenbachiella versicolor TaxID=1821036 RepID=UPI000D6E58E9|nr:PIG-L family deacetylase [Reichenbachiella versicolor]
MKIKFLMLAISMSVYQAFALKPKSYPSSQIQHMLNKLEVLGSVLYVAAHPDDENTRVISYMANDRHYYTSYLSATRGDGGQNLIGPEIRESLGVIRTQELLAARRTDGGTQYFSRANDFGYSKTPEETFEIWDKQQVLEDFVMTIRKHKPDVIITRFPEDGGGGHGHHTASALLAAEAFNLAADDKAFPESAAIYGTWQSKRLFFNTSVWFYRRTNSKMDTAKFYTIDIGKYNSLLGESYSEIAAKSRSQHKSQGFGTIGTRGKQTEYFEFLYGEKPEGAPSEVDLFQSIDTSWDRLDETKSISKIVSKIKSNFNPANPSGIVPSLVTLRKQVNVLENETWRLRKLAEIDELILACSGLYVEAVASDYSYTLGDAIDYTLEVVNRSSISMKLKEVSIGSEVSVEIDSRLIDNAKFSQKGELKIPTDYSYTNPYWLDEPGTVGMYVVKNKMLIGTPENQPAFTVRFRLDIEGQEVVIRTPLIYKKRDPVRGEVYKPLEIVPPVMVNISDPVYVFGNGYSKNLEVNVLAGKSGVKGQVKLDVPKGWKIEPQSFEYSLKQKGSEKSFTFKVSPPDTQSVGYVSAIASYNGKNFDKSIVRIEYDHIPNQIILPEAKSKLVKIELEKKGQNVAYIKGAGDQIPNSLRQVGYTVTELSNDQIKTDVLSQYDAVILGVRAFNTNESLKFHTEDLKEYVKQGGNVVVQYNTSHALKTKDIAPYDLTLSRDRVTKEEAEIKVLAPDHQVLNFPNKITQKDFDGWVQERGLYFPNKWADEFTPILSSHDPNEPARDGGLLVAKYGKGYYVYSGYSWFRQLPAGVPGAYRLFTNLISIGQK